jgi:hypothetical protein
VTDQFRGTLGSKKGSAFELREIRTQNLATQETKKDEYIFPKKHQSPSINMESGHGLEGSH